MTRGGIDLLFDSAREAEGRKTGGDLGVTFRGAPSFHIVQF
jgi:hypothetical protein